MKICGSANFPIGKAKVQNKSRDARIIGYIISKRKERSQENHCYLPPYSGHLASKTSQVKQESPLHCALSLLLTFHPLSWHFLLSAYKIYIYIYQLNAISSHALTHHSSLITFTSQSLASIPLAIPSLGSCHST